MISIFISFYNSFYSGLVDNHKQAGSVQLFDLDLLLYSGSQVFRVHWMSTYRTFDGARVY